MPVRFGAEDLYIPKYRPNDTVLNLLRENSERNISDIRRMGDLNADRYRIAGENLASGIDKAATGYERGAEMARRGRQEARSEEELAMRQAEEHRRAELHPGEVAEQAARARMSEEEIARAHAANEEATRQAGYANTINPKTGKTYGEEMYRLPAVQADLARAGLATQQQNLKIAQAQAAREQEQYLVNQAATGFQQAFATDTDANVALHDQYRKAAQGIPGITPDKIKAAMDQNGSKKVQELRERLSQSGMSEAAISQAMQMGQSAYSNNVASKDLYLTSGPGADAMADISSVNNKIQKVKSLEEAGRSFANYRAGSKEEQGARAQVVSILRELHRDQEAQEIEKNLTLDTYGIRRGSTLINSAVNDVKTETASQLKTIRDLYGYLPSQTIQGKLTAAESAIATPSGGTERRPLMLINGKPQAVNPFQPAMVQPQAPQQQFRPLPTSTGTVQLPGMAPGAAPMPPMPPPQHDYRRLQYRGQ